MEEMLALPESLGGLGEYRTLIQVFAIVFATLLLSWLGGRILDRLERRLRHTPSIYDDAMIYAARQPLSWLILLLGLSYAAELAGRDVDVEVFELIVPLRALGVIILVALFAWRSIGYIEQRSMSREYRDNPLDATTATAIGKLLRISVFITALITAAQTLGFSIAGLLAFGGMGGIAVGFAARDLLANFFGAFIIYLDRPFKVGEWVRSPDREIEGTVEDIGWRVTRIRTFDQRPLYVPNSIFTQITVETPSRMFNRRIFETIGVRYVDVGALPSILEDARQMLRDHDDIAQDRLQMVNFNAFGGSSLDFMVYAFTRTTNWAEFHAIKEDVLFRIADIIAHHGGEVAFPTRTLHLDSLPEGALGGTGGVSLADRNQVRDSRPESRPEPGERGPDMEGGDQGGH